MGQSSNPFDDYQKAMDGFVYSFYLRGGSNFPPLNGSKLGMSSRVVPIIEHSGEDFSLSIFQQIIQ